MNELVLIEGDEEVQYILVDLPDDAPASIDAPGTTLQLQGLDTDEPLLLDAEGNVLLRGRHQDTLGSVLVMALAPDGSGARPRSEPAAGAGAQAGGAAAQPAGEGGGRAGAQQRPQQQRPAGTRYLCHLEKRLVFQSADAGEADGR